MARPLQRPLHLQLLCAVAAAASTLAQDAPDSYNAPDARDAHAAHAHHASGWLPPSPPPPLPPPPPGPGEDGVAGAALQDRQPGAPAPAAAAAPTAKDSAAAAAAAASSSLVPFAYTHGSVAGYGSPLGTGLAAAAGSLGSYAEPLAHLADHHSPHHPRGHHHLHGDHHGDHHAHHADHLHQEHHYAEHELEDEHHDKKSAAGHIAMGFLAYMAVLAVLQGGLIALTRGPTLWGVAARRRRDLTRVPTLDPAPPEPPLPPQAPAAPSLAASAHAPQGRPSSRVPPRDATAVESEGDGAGDGAGESDRCVEFGVCTLGRQLSSQLGSTGRLLARYISAWAGLSLGRELRARAEAAGDAGLRLGDCARLFPGCAQRQRRHAADSVGGNEVK